MFLSFPRFSRAALVAGVCLLAPLSAGADTPAAAEAGPHIPFERYTLQNGLEVILHQDRSVPLVAVNVWYHVGSGDEAPGMSGFAHLFEHMMFQGSQHTAEDAHFKVLKEIGATAVNGTTNADRTNYFQVVPAHQLQVALWLESDRMGYLLPKVTQRSLDNQRSVVQNERRQVYENRPYGKEWFAVLEALYAEGHPYRYGTIGRHEDIVAATLADVHDFHRIWYVPANATLALAGDFDRAHAKALIEKWFGSFPPSVKPERRRVKPTTIRRAQRIEVSDPLAKLRRIRYAWHAPAFFAPGDAELDIAALTLGRPGSVRLYKTLVHKHQLAHEVSVYQASQGFSSVFYLVVDLKPNAPLDKVEDLINSELTALRQRPMTVNEFQRAVIAFETDVIWALEGLLYRSNLLQRYNHYLGDPEYLSRDLDRYRTTTPERVQAVVADVLSPNRVVQVITLPAGGNAP